MAVITDYPDMTLADDHGHKAIKLTDRKGGTECINSLGHSQRELNIASALHQLYQRYMYVTVK